MGWYNSGQKSRNVALPLPQSKVPKWNFLRDRAEGQTGAVSPYGSLEAGYKKAHTHANTHAHAQNTVSLESGDYV